MTYSLDESILGIVGAFVVIAVTWYAISLRARTLGSALIYGWVSMAALTPLSYLADWSFGTPVEHLFNFFDLTLLAIVVILTIVHVGYPRELGTSPG